MLVRRGYKRGFYRAANSIFGKIERTASEEVTLHLIKSKCVPILLYGLELNALLNQSQVKLRRLCGQSFSDETL